MKQTYTLLLCFISAFAFAQPTLTSAWAPTTGQHIRITYFNNLTSTSQGSAGAAQTWNLTGIDTTGSLNQIYVAPSSVTGGNNFASATDCGTDGVSDFTFDKVNSAIYQMIGHIAISTGDTLYTLFSDPLDIYHFPETYNSSFNDFARDKQVTAGSTDTTYESTTESVTIDGYGTLTTDAGTFSNVLRAHISLTSVDTSFLGGSLNSIDSIITNTYFWISPSYPGVVLANISHTAEDGFAQDLGYFSEISSSTVGITNINGNSISWSVIPQPAANKANVILSSAKSGLAEINIYDMTGRVVSNLSTNLNVGRNAISIDVSGLANGIYTISITTDGTTNAQKLVVRN